MRRMWGVLGAGLIAGAVLAPLLSCNVIQGDLELLVDESASAWSPCWSTDGTKIYFILGEEVDEYEDDEPGYVWSLEVETGSRKQISDQPLGELLGEIETSRYDDLFISAWKGWIRILDIETWTQLDSFPAARENYLHQPKFSYESDQVIYYTLWATNSVFLHRINRADSTDEELIASGPGFVFAGGPGDTLVALSDTICNLNSGEKIPLGITPQSLDWNPVVPTEILICTYDDEDLFIFDLETQKLRRINASPKETYNSREARFSPHGDRIVFTAFRDSDGRRQIWLFEPSD